MNFNSSTLCGCAPTQIVTFTMAINSNDLNHLKIYGECNNIYDNSSLKFGYSLDGVCWSCYISYEDLLANTLDLKQDFYLRFKVQGTVNGIELCCGAFTNYSTALDSDFTFSYCTGSSTSNMYNPYANMTSAIGLQQYMADTVVCMFGIPVYYFRVTPEEGSKDITFKEYTLLNAEPPKQIKLMIADGTMPSSKPEFNDFSFDWQTDWETEIGKTMFATAFGANAQPMEGDFIWIPMMKRMWQVSGAYDEKNQGLMWTSTTFKVTLVKYEDRGHVDLGDQEDLVESYIKNTYEDLFGEDNEDTAGTNADTLQSPQSAYDNLYPIYKSDATRKYITCTGININDDTTYFKGTLISEAWYTFDGTPDRQIVYQKQYCGDNISISFIIKPLLGEYKGTLLSIGALKINIEQTGLFTTISVNKDKKLSVELTAGNIYFIYIRWSKDLNISEIGAVLYTYNQNIPLYKLQNQHYYYDVDNCVNAISKWNIELNVSEKTDVVLRNLYGLITNIKIFDIYNDNISEMIQQYPTNNKLIINDTARKLVGLDGVKIR